MENKQVSAKKSLPSLWQGENNLNKEASILFAKTVQTMSLAKNIKLAEGTIGAWEICLIEDMKAQMFNLSDFILATKKVIREPLFNRIDYADIYQLAKELAKTRWGKDQPGRQPDYNPSPMPEKIKTMLSDIGEKI